MNLVSYAFNQDQHNGAVIQILLCSNKVLVLNLAGAFLCGVCMFFMCLPLWVFSWYSGVLPQSKDYESILA